ncbi:hypothetical protein [Escherichia coli]|uniref:hypothetical protein n=1 Tax=Escherichia coli TaxID=562 RepID=UPI00156C135E|nr:hypothetical protein [Escherichia coli]
MLDFRRVLKNREIQPEAAFCPTKNQGLEWMNSNPRMQIADKFITTDYLQQCQISCQLKLIRFTGESAIAFSLLSGQKVNGHIGLPA